MLGGVALACLAGRAEASDARLRLAVPPRSYADALIDLGVQANISLLGASACGSAGRTELAPGRYTLEAALARLLAGAPCRYRIIDSRTVHVTAASKSQTPTREPPRSPPSLVSELVVTATKRPAAAGRLPGGVSAISREQITATGAVDLGQTVGQLAGVLSTNLGPGRDKLLIRGLSDGAFTGRARSTVSTYLDDTPINLNAPDPDLRLVDVARVEVVRGPQGALYGSGALSGIYRIVTTKPDLERYAAGFSASLFSTRGGDPGHDVDGYVNLPLAPDRASLRLVAYEEVQGGYIDDVNLRIANVDQTRRSGGRLALRVQVGDKWRIDALAATQNLRSNDTQYVTPGTAAGPSQRANHIREAHNNDFSYVSAAVLGDFAWGSVASSVSYVHHVFSSQYDASSQLRIVAADPEALGVFSEAAQADMLVQDLVIRSSGVNRFDWLVGAFASRTIEPTNSTLNVLTTGPMLTTVYAEARKDRLSELAIYGEGSYDLGGGWSASVGGRIFETRVRTTADLEVVQPFGPRSFNRSRTFKGFSPKISVQRELPNGDLVYGLITEGYRPGGFNSSGFFPIRASRTAFAPDRLRNYEVGVKFRRLHDRLGVRAAAYLDDWVNIQTDRYRRSGLGYTANVSDARIVGLEAEVGYDWPFGLSLQLNGLISDSQVRNPNPDLEVPITPNLPGVPKASGGLLAVYERPLAGDLTIRLLVAASYVGRSALSFDASSPPRMGHYLRARLSTELAGDSWRVAAFVSNPLDEAGDTFAYGNPFSFEQVRQVTPQRPRTYGVRLAANF